MTKLREIAHSRTGDKGNINNLSVIAYEESDWPLIREKVTNEVVLRQLGFRIEAVEARYELPKVRTLLFRVRRAPEDTVAATTWNDAHGKSLSSVLLDADIDTPEPDQV